MPKKIELSLLTKPQAIKYKYEATLSHPNYPRVPYYLNEHIIYFSYFNISASYSKLERSILLENFAVFLRNIIYNIIIVSLPTSPLVLILLLIIFELTYVFYYSYLSLRKRHLKRWIIFAQRITSGFTVIFVCLIGLYSYFLNWNINYNKIK